MSDRLDEVLDAAAAESDASKLDDAEIQRLVALSRDASYRRTERVPVKSIEAFDPVRLCPLQWQHSVAVKKRCVSMQRLPRQLRLTGTHHLTRWRLMVTERGCRCC